MNADTCISCGEIVPEGRMVCPRCEGAVNVYRAEAIGSRQVISALVSGIDKRDAEIARLTAERDEAQRRADAAVEDLCDCCKGYAKLVMLPTDCLACPQRGPQRAERGERV